MGQIRETLRLALATAAFFGISWFLLSLCAPNLYIRIFMTPTSTILAMAPAIIRKYSLSFLLLPFNIFSTYYFQAIMKPKASFIVSVSRGLVISGALIMILPLINPDAIWYAMPITELAVTLYAAVTMKKYTSELPREKMNRQSVHAS